MGIVQTLQEPVDGEGPPELGLGAGVTSIQRTSALENWGGGRLPGLNGLGLRSLEVCEARAGLPVLG